jgi:hypothetical protein
MEGQVAMGVLAPYLAILATVVTAAMQTPRQRRGMLMQELKEVSEAREALQGNAGVMVVMAVTQSPTLSVGGLALRALLAVTELPIQGGMAERGQLQPSATTPTVTHPPMQ